MTAERNALTPPTSFVGRDHELAELREALATARLVTISGPGGTGKTRLALELAKALAAEGTEVWIVELAAVPAAGDVVPAVVDALGWTEVSGDDPIGDIATRLRSRTGMLVLDNCEHVLDGAAAVARAVTAVCDDLRVITTSREPLRAVGELIWRLAPLRAPGPGEHPTASDLEAMSSAQLLVERVRLHDRSFALDESNADAVGRICAALDGLPLAIELAAPWFRVLGAEEVAGRVEESLDLLAAYHSATSERHRTLAATMEWSYELLSEREQLLLTRLSVFAGGFGIEAVESVCSGHGIEGEEVVPLLARLVDTSLVVTERRGEITQYRLLETVREFSRSRLGARAHGTSTTWAFRRNGELWSVGPQPVQLPHAKGLGYIHRLVERMGEEVHVLDLTGGIAEGQIGPALDDRARRAYRERLADLRSEADEASAFNDPERAARAEAEIDAILTELSAAVGLGGRDRPVASSSERARTSVTKAIRWAIRRIGDVDAGVADHLRHAVHTGTYCRYEPGAVQWELGEGA